MTKISDILKNNETLKNTIKNQSVKDLPSIIKNNVSRPIINIYDSGWEHHASAVDDNIKTSTKNAILPSYLNISKKVQLDLPEYLLPFLKTNIIVEGNPNIEATGILEYRNDTIVNTMDAYYNGALIFSGIAKEAVEPESQLLFYPTLAIQRPHIAGEYTTMINKLPVWMIDIQWDEQEAPISEYTGELGLSHTYRCRNALVFEVESKMYSYNFAGPFVIDSTSQYGHCTFNQQSDYFHPIFNTANPVTQAIKDNYQAPEIIELTNSGVTIKSVITHHNFNVGHNGAFQANVTFDVNTNYSINTTQTFNFDDCIIVFSGVLEVLYNDVWYPLGYSSSNRMYGSGYLLAQQQLKSDLDNVGISDGVKTLYFRDIYSAYDGEPHDDFLERRRIQNNKIFSNARLYGYVPCYDSRKLLQVTYFPKRRDWQPEVYGDRSWSEYMGWSYNLEFGAGFKSPWYGFNELVEEGYGPSTTALFNSYTGNTFRVNFNPIGPKIGSPLEPIFFVPTENYYYDSVNDTYIIQGYRSTKIIKDTTTEKNLIAIDSLVVLKTLATKKDDTTFRTGDRTFQFHTPSTFEARFDKIEDSQEDAGENSNIYKAETSDVRVKITIDLVNPFYYHEEKIIDRN